MLRNGLQGWHILVVLVVIVLLFGANKLPGLARSVGQSLKIFKDEVKDLKDTPADKQPGAAGPVVPPADAPAPQPGTVVNGVPTPPHEGGKPPAV
ncbi:Sec-independent protein translocase subunit TatA [Cellulomonas massiliensis]|uniref:Sec-independent protein translocase subunit TatA n=1 Tax=Cellulomonas massiliensis TaxID=1465811 RepID=UPI000316ECE2|nr:Sec-independent protein translocase subunit TatA [Cellulomonas massiliensis]